MRSNTIHTVFDPSYLPSFLTMSARCLYCLTTVPVPKDEDDVPVCESCRLDGEADYAYRKWKADFDKRNAGKVLGSRCKSCDDFIPRYTWCDDKPPLRCHICESGHKHKERMDAMADEIKRWREEDEAAAPYIIEAMRAVLLGEKK